MRRLMLLRHAKTERADPGQRDRDRKLTKRGRDDAAVIGAYMARHGLAPDLALVSPAKRAQETWALVAPAFAKAPRVVNDERIYNAATDALFKIIGETRGAHSLLVVGHNPSLSEFLGRLISETGCEASTELKKGAVAKVETGRNSGVLLWSVTPRLVRDLYAAAAESSRPKTSRK